MSAEFRKRLSLLVKEISSNDKIPSDERIKLVTDLSEIGNPLQTDKWIYRIVVLFLGGAVTITLVGGFLVYTKGAELPQGLVALGSAAVGALAGLLAPSPAR